jgi:hypothetical protein
VLVSANVALPVINWSNAASGTFDAGGVFSFTNSINPNVPNLFYLLQVP